MQESRTYQAIIAEGKQIGLAEGKIEGEVIAARKTIDRQGKRLGKRSRKQTLALNAITDLERLERMVDRVRDAADWNDLLATP